MQAKVLSFLFDLQQLGNDALLSASIDLAEVNGLDEHLVQVLWNEVHFGRDFHLADGRRLRVLRPGTWNREAGPDFLDAEIEIGGVLRRGAIEIHVDEGEWRRHGHHLDPAYREVILHVVWRGGAPALGMPPLLELSPLAEVPADQLRQRYLAHEYPRARMLPPERLSELFNDIDDGQLGALLEMASLLRLEVKARHLRRSAQARGWDQSLQESLFDCLGFKANRLPFRQLAAAASVASLRELPSDEAREAYLWGMSGLLPDPTRVELTPRLKSRIETLWRLWWPLRPEEAPADSWVRHGLRPLNSPERRVAAAVALLQRWQWRPVAIAEAMRSLPPGRPLMRGLEQILSCADADWEACSSPRHQLPRPCSLIGRDRRLAIAANALFPFLAAQAEKDSEACRQIAAAYLSLPGGDDNSRLDQARHRFFLPPSRLIRVATTAARQQGVLQLQEDFNGSGEEALDFWRSQLSHLPAGASST